MVDKDNASDWQKRMVQKEIANLGEIKILTKTINLFTGCSLAGKTATCLHLVDSAIRNKKIVFYFDTEGKTIMERPDPKLFKKFYEKNKMGYDKYFKYSDDFDDKTFFDVVDKEKPDLIVIDSIYRPFVNKYAQEHPKGRAKIISGFVNKLRNYVTNKRISAIITTPIEKDGNEERVLGGEGLKYVSDIKVWIQFSDGKDSVSSKNGKHYYKRFFVVDRQFRYAFQMDGGGNITIEG